ncbi:MAG: NADH-quinone oxidoreductase subunit J [Verrucomicrobiota bacterium]|nr:NADH-quinone oxidoreductase subunit J [Verrucomicrobiota bacterium]
MNVGGSIEPVVFAVFAVLTLAAGFLVVANPISRNPVTSAMFLVLTILSVAGLFVLLGAFFLAAVQVLVYAGAVIVLFLFVLMVWGGDGVERVKLRKFAMVVGGASLAVFLALLAGALLAAGQDTKVGLAEGSARSLGELLVSRHLLAFELIALMLLAAVIGSVFLGRKEDK